MLIDKYENRFLDFNNSSIGWELKKGSIGLFKLDCKLKIKKTNQLYYLAKTVVAGNVYSKSILPIIPNYNYQWAINGQKRIVFRNFKNKNRQKLLYWCFFFVLTALSVICYKLNIFYEIRNDFPRSGSSGYLSNIFSLLKSYLLPYYKLEGSVFASKRYCTSTWENSVYIGLIAFIFIFFS